MLVAAQLSDVSGFCLDFYNEHSTEMFEPFIYREDERHYGEFPENYIEALEHLCETWGKEKNRYSGETLEATSTDEAEKLTGEEAAQKEVDIIVAIERQSSKS